MSSIATRTFTADDQRHFAEFSGDHNPLHMDAVAARKTQAGSPAVHGVNAMLWALDAALSVLPDLQLGKISAQFERFVQLEQPIDLVVGPHRRGVRLELQCGGMRLATITLGPRPGPETVAAREYVAECHPEPLPRYPIMLNFAEASSSKGAFRLDPMHPGDCYAHLLSRVDIVTLRGIAALSSLVGMVTPGLNSILSKIELMLDGSPCVDFLRYETVESHEVYSLIELAVQGPGFSAEVGAFLRPAPVAQPSFAALREIVPKHLCSGVDALVIGGSRGIGEVTAKIIAAGGGRVCITYASGQDDADRVAAEIINGGALCGVAPFDARQPAALQLEALPFSPNHLYYYATPRIFRQRLGFFSSNLFAEYNTIYSIGLYDLCESLALHRPLRVFYPSSTAVSERPAGLIEYAMAKAASEILCEEMNRDLANIDIMTKRLPRIDTDQTATLTAVEAEPIIPIVQKIVREMLAD